MPGSAAFFEGEVFAIDAAGPSERLVARLWWKDEEHGWRRWEGYHFAYNNYLRLYLRRPPAAPPPGAAGLDDGERAILARRLGGEVEAVLERAGLDPGAIPAGSVLRVVYGREPDLDPWYRNPIHRTLADLETVEFEWSPGGES